MLKRLPVRIIKETAAWVKEWHYQHCAEPDVETKLAQALRERLRNKYDVHPDDLDTEAARVLMR